MTGNMAAFRAAILRDVGDMLG